MSIREKVKNSKPDLALKAAKRRVLGRNRKVLFIVGNDVTGQRSVDSWLMCRGGAVWFGADCWAGTKHLDFAKQYMAVHKFYQAWNIASLEGVI